MVGDYYTDATWNQLIKALKSPSVQLDGLADQLEDMIIDDCELYGSYTRRQSQV